MNSSEKPIPECYGRIAGFGPLHRGYHSLKQAPRLGDRLVWLVAPGDLRHYVTIGPGLSQCLAVLYREDTGAESTFSIPTGPDAFIRLGAMDGYKMLVEFGREDTLEQLAKWLVVLTRDGDEIRVEFQESEGDSLPWTTF